MSTTITTSKGPGCLVQFLWFILVGWWMGQLAVGLAYFLMVTIIGIPIAILIDIVGLQEVWASESQDTLAQAWVGILGLETLMYDPTAPLGSNVLRNHSLRVLPMGPFRSSAAYGQIIDARPNTIESYIVYGPHVVMGQQSRRSFITWSLPALPGKTSTRSSGRMEDCSS